MSQPLKVLHIGKYFAPFNGGLENYQRDAMVALADHGVESAALVHQHELTLKSSEETVPAHGLDLPLIRVATWFKLLFTPISPGFPSRLSRLIKSFQPDLLHLHMPNPSAFWCLFLPAARKLPWVVHWHADVITEQQDWKMKLFYQIYKHFERATLKQAVAIVATSPPYLASSQPLQPWLPKCHVVPLGAEPSRLNHAAKAAPIPHDDITASKAPLKVLAIGRLTYYKGFQHLIKAAALVPELQVAIVGTGDQEHDLKALTASLKLAKQVTFLGALDDQQLAGWMTWSDCLCLPSIERTEAFGMVLLEAQSLAKATVVSDVPGSGMGWVVDHQKTGLKVPPANSEALAAALSQLHNDRATMQAMGKNGLHKFQKEFDINQAIKKLIPVYQHAIGKREQLT